MTKRSRSICVILAIILAVLLEVLTMSIMKYNVLLAIVSTILYFATFLFAIIDGYCAFKNDFSKYHIFWATSNMALLGVQLPIYYFLGNMRTMEISQIIITIVVAAVFFYIAINFGKLARKNCTYTYPE